MRRIVESADRGKLIMACGTGKTFTSLKIAAVKTFADFRALSQAGRELAHWHLNYETVACHPGAWRRSAVMRRDLFALLPLPGR